MFAIALRNTVCACGYVSSCAGRICMQTTTIMTRSDAANRLIAAIHELGDDELRVLATVSDRLQMGLKQYGKLDIDGDPREWLHEMSEELLDASVYGACALLRRNVG